MGSKIPIRAEGSHWLHSLSVYRYTASTGCIDCASALHLVSQDDLPNQAQRLSAYSLPSRAVVVCNSSQIWRAWSVNPGQDDPPYTPQQTSECYAQWLHTHLRSTSLYPAFCATRQPLFEPTCLSSCRQVLDQFSQYVSLPRL